jgi:hypothetical protein
VSAARKVHLEGHTEACLGETGLKTKKGAVSGACLVSWAANQFSGFREIAIFGVS